MKNKITSILFFSVIFVFSALCIFLPKDEFSESERRELKGFPEISSADIFSGEFSSDFEEYATDSFPFRDAFRSAKAYSSKYLFLLRDNNKLFRRSGHLSKIDYPLNTHMLDNAESYFSFIFENYLKDKNANVFFSIIPDKSQFLDTLKYNYEEVKAYMTGKMPYSEYIDIFAELSLDDYYYTDSHWRQEKIFPVAKKLAGAMDADITAEYGENVLDIPFYGVYVGQSALKSKPDVIKYITSDALSACNVSRVNDMGKTVESAMFDFEKAGGRDAYEFFLSGNQSIVKIENPDAKAERKLIIFRDSFASSLAPYFVPAYSEIYLVDLRYISKSALIHYIDFSNSDVLFLYSASMLNASDAFNKF